MFEIARLLLEAARTRESRLVFLATSLLEGRWVPIASVERRTACVNILLEGAPARRIQVDFPSGTVAVSSPDGVTDYESEECLADALLGLQLPVLTMLVGLPGAGKSTWCRRQTAPVVSPDALRRALGIDPHKQQNLDPILEDRVWAAARLAVAGLFLTGSPEVILDATFVQVSRRRAWLPGSEQAPELRGVPYRARAIYIETPLEICLQRRPEIPHVVNKMAHRMEPPTSREPFFEIQRIDGSLSPRSPYPE